MQLNLLHGYPDLVGKRSIFCGNGSGPTSYVTGGDPITVPQFQYYIDAILGGATLSTSGTYYVLAKSSGIGSRQTWKLVWTVTATDAEVSAGTNLSAETVQIGGFGGTY